MKIFNETSLKPAWIVAAIAPPQLSATWIVKGTFTLNANGAATAVEKGEFPTGDLPHPDGRPESLKYEGDFAPFKPRTDVLLAGTCHVPGGKPTARCRVSLQVGDWKKTIVAIGDRQWRQGLSGATTSEPAPFTSMPVRYELAYGGPSYGRNPLGRGHGTAVLPNLEDPKRPVSSPAMETEPAGFGPIPRTWEQRTTRPGTYDSVWLKERWPWFPRDFDWAHFNAAPRDQQLDGYLQGDEPLELENLHPVHARYQTRLPGIRPQLFVVDGYGTREAPLKLDTVWVDADKEKLILLWRGSLPIQSIKMADLREVHVVQTLLEGRPATWAELVRAAELEKAEASRARAEARAEEAADASALDATVARVEEEAAAAVEAAEAKVGRAVAAVSADLELTGVPRLPLPGTAVAPVDFSSLPEFLEAAAAADPIAASIISQLPAIVAPEVGDVESDEAWTRERCLQHAADEGSFAEQDLSGLDLSGADFSGRDFNGAVLTGATLQGCRLSQCDFARADLSNVVMTAADLTDADLARADLSGAQLSEARMDGACLERANLAGAAMTNTSLRNVRGDRADFSSADLTGASLRDGRFFKADFSEATLERADFSNAFLEHAILEAANGPAAIFVGADVRSLHAGKGATFPGASFKECTGDSSYWEGANLDGADFTRAGLIRADFDSASLKQAHLEAADLRDAVLDDAKLDLAVLRSANLFRASIQRGSLRGADLRGANLYESDVWNAVFEGARLDGANVQMTKLLQTP
jgi:uncharacterized protein YjbI with pentapeptide repeats